MSTTLREDLTKFINLHNIDSELNTPDYIIADHLIRHIYDLKIFNDKNIEWHDWNTELGR